MKRSYIIVGALALLAFILTYALFAGVIAPKSVVEAKVDLAAGTRLTADVLVLERAGPLCANVLKQRSPGGNVQKLHPAADPENRPTGIKSAAH